MGFNRSFSQTKVKSHEYDAGLQKYMSTVYNYMALALLLSGIVSFGVVSSETLLMALFGNPVMPWIVAFAPLAIVFYISARIYKMSESQAQMWFWIFASVMGMSLAPIFLVYTGASIAKVFFITAASFGALSIYGYTTKKDLSGWGSFLFIGLIGIIIGSVVNFFLASPALHYAISAAGVLIFAGFTAYDTQNIKHSYYVVGNDKKTAIYGALKLYLDFINLMIFLLQFLGDRR